MPGRTPFLSVESMQLLDGRISAVKTSTGQSLSPDSVVLSAASATYGLAAQVGAFAPVYPVKGYVIEAKSVATCTLPPPPPPPLHLPPPPPRAL